MEHTEFMYCSVSVLQNYYKLKRVGIKNRA